MLILLLILVWSRDDFEVLEAVKAGKWEWPKNVAVSSTGKDFVSRLLVVDPTERLTGEEALDHRWMKVGFKITVAF